VIIFRAKNSVAIQAGSYVCVHEDFVKVLDLNDIFPEKFQDDAESVDESDPRVTRITRTRRKSKKTRRKSTPVRRLLPVLTRSEVAQRAEDRHNRITRFLASHPDKTPTEINDAIYPGTVLSETGVGSHLRDMYNKKQFFVRRLVKDTPERKYYAYSLRSRDKTSTGSVPRGKDVGETVEDREDALSGA
jgi:hypothetical protein